MPEYKDVRHLQPGDVIVWAGRPHEVISYPNRSRQFDFYLHVDLMDVESREKFTESLLAFGRLLIVKGDPDNAA